MTMNNISLYFHIPFCVRKCDYCAFYSLGNQKDELKQEYFQALCRQIDFFETDKTVSTVYFGGGTPPVLGVERICALISKVKDRFELTKDCEITVEINPCSVDFCDLLKLRQIGVNRLSVGIQSADDGILASIGRMHSFQQAEDCIRNARKAGFSNISADIIFGLPELTLETFRDSVLKISEIGVDHISAYSLQLEEGTALFKRADKLRFPDEEEEEAQYDALCEILREKGFIHYEISSFCKEGFESVHNSNYWFGGDYFGFGAGAHSFFQGKRFSGVCDVRKFIEASHTSIFAPTDFFENQVLGQDELEEERILLGLRTNKGAVIPEGKKEVAQRIANMGFGTFADSRLVLNSKGFRVSNSIISQILL